MKVFVVYTHAAYEGNSPPIKTFKYKNDAVTFCEIQNKDLAWYDDLYQYEEMEVQE